MANLVFSATSLVVHTPGNDAAGQAENPNEKFEGRVPIILRHRDLYVGLPNWFHEDLYSYYGLTYEYDDCTGYFGGGSSWGQGALTWYAGSQPEVDNSEVVEALNEAGYNVPPAQEQDMSDVPDPSDPIWDDDDLWD